MRRNFEDEGANDIVTLPVCRPTPYSQASLLKRAIGDFQYEILQDGEDLTLGDTDTESSSPTKKRKPSYGGFTLVHRPKTLGGSATCSASESECESSSDEFGFSLVHRPKPEKQLELTSVLSPMANNSYATPFTSLIPSNPFQDPDTSVAIKSEPEIKHETPGPAYDDEWDPDDWEPLEWS